MITSLQLKQSQLDQLYDWIDGLPLSKPKKNISRDFSDGILMAEVVHQFYPKIVQLHNYPSGNSYKVKLTNWQTLKNKVLVKLGIHLTEDDCSRLANASAMAIEAVLYQVKRIIDDSILLYEQQNSPMKGTVQPVLNTKRQEQSQRSSNPRIITHQNHNASKSDQLKQILALIKQKTTIVQKSLQRKDAQIRQLQQILRESGQ